MRSRSCSQRAKRNRLQRISNFLQPLALGLRSGATGSISSSCQWPSCGRAIVHSRYLGNLSLQSLPPLQVCLATMGDDTSTPTRILYTLPADRRVGEKYDHIDHTLLSAPVQTVLGLSKPTRIGRQLGKDCQRRTRKVDTNSTRSHADHCEHRGGGLRRPEASQKCLSDWRGRRAIDPDQWHIPGFGRSAQPIENAYVMRKRDDLLTSAGAMAQAISKPCFRSSSFQDPTPLVVGECPELVICQARWRLSCEGKTQSASAFLW
mmetsp:Transcript_151812/g.487149  ORF Transcript_151812/g.487149 Transcript_151812/m.487149 type:complete len:263 (-) Transcript_151812:1140-1928(-)